MQTEQPRPIEILLVEDSPTDRLIAKEALDQIHAVHHLSSVENGIEAMQFLWQEGKYQSAKRPDLILLDLNLPKKDGREVLREIKTDPRFSLIPVVVMTTSQADEDVVRCYEYQANSYIAKPVDFSRFSEVVKSINHYWFEVVTLPSTDAVQRILSKQEVAPRPTQVAPSKTIRVLLLEDNPTDVLLFRDALANSSISEFEVSHVERMRDARGLLASQSFDVIVADLGLPDTEGLETYRQVRACSKGIPILVLTGLDDEALGMSALREGAQEYFVKGDFNPRSLLRALRYAIEKQQLEERLRQAQRMEALGRLSAGLAHDFNNLLTVIQGRIDLILAESGDWKLLLSAHEIQRAATRASNLTQQLLTFSRQQVMKPKPLSLSKAVENVGQMVRMVLGEQIQLELKLPDNLPYIDADPAMVDQVVINLAVNARDAMPRGGKLLLETSFVELTPADAAAHADRYPGSFVCLSVDDTGSGIAPEVIPHIFDPFYITKSADRGGGLGLATVYSILQQHRGWGEVESEVGKGTLFRVFLPASKECPTQEAPKKTPPLARGTETILLVEDERQVRMLTRMILERQGYTVLEAEGGQEALALWEQAGAQVNLLLTDMLMPGLSGRELANALTQKRPDLKVLYMSGYSRDFTNPDIRLEEGVNFIAKPFDIQTLLSAVQTQLTSEPAGD